MVKLGFSKKLFLNLFPSSWPLKAAVVLNYPMSFLSSLSSPSSLEVVKKDRVHVILDLKIFFMMFHGCSVLDHAAQFESAHTSIDRDRLCDVHVGNESASIVNESLSFGYVALLPL